VPAAPSAVTAVPPELPPIAGAASVLPTAVNLKSGKQAVRRTTRDKSPSASRHIVFVSVGGGLAVILLVVCAWLLLPRKKSSKTVGGRSANNVAPAHVAPSPSPTSSVSDANDAKASIAAAPQVTQSESNV